MTKTLSALAERQLERRAKHELAVVGKILWLRQQYHFGPQKIAM